MVWELRTPISLDLSLSILHLAMLKPLEAAFLPAVYQAARFGRSSRGPRRRGSVSAIPNITNPVLDRELQRMQLDFVQDLNRRELERQQASAGDRGHDRVL